MQARTAGAVETRSSPGRMCASGPGYALTMTVTPEPPEDRPIDLAGVPAEEGISEADAADRLEKDPDEQENQEEL